MWKLILYYCQSCYLHLSPNSSALLAASQQGLQLESTQLTVTDSSSLVGTSSIFSSFTSIGYRCHTLLLNRLVCPFGSDTLTTAALTCWSWPVIKSFTTPSFQNSLLLASSFTTTISPFAMVGRFPCFRLWLGTVWCLNKHQMWTDLWKPDIMVHTKIFSIKT